MVKFFTVIENFDEIIHRSEWPHVEKFKSAGRVVTKDGRDFCIIAKKQRPLGWGEWIYYLFQKKEETIRLGICIDPCPADSEGHKYVSISENNQLNNRNLTIYQQYHYAISRSQPVSYEAQNMSQDISFENESIDNRYILKALYLYILNEIKQQTAENTSSHRLLLGRKIVINDNVKSPFSGVSRTLLDHSKAPHTSFSTIQEYYDATFLGVVINKLKEQKHISKVLSINENIWELQGSSS